MATSNFRSLKISNKSREERRLEVAEKLASHVLREGLQGASLRPLAAAAGTTDRMLLYYFTDKDELIATVLAVIAQRLSALLEAALPGQWPYAALLERVSELWTSPALEPYVQVFLELACLSSRNVEPFRTISGQLFDGFLVWTAARLQVDREEDRQAAASLLLATVDGIALLNALGRPAAAAGALAFHRLRSGG